MAFLVSSIETSKDQHLLRSLCITLLLCHLQRKILSFGVSLSLSHTLRALSLTHSPIHRVCTITLYMASLKRTKNIKYFFQKPDSHNLSQILLLLLSMKPMFKITLLFSKVQSKWDLQDAPVGFKQSTKNGGTFNIVKSIILSGANVWHSITMLC